MTTNILALIKSNTITNYLNWRGVSGPVPNVLRFSEPTPHIHILLLVVLLFTFCSVHAQRTVVEGTVQDSTQSSLPDVSILISGTQQGTVTDAEGFFQLSAPPGTYDLLFSHLEYTSVLQQVNLTEGDTLRLLVTLRPNVRILEQVEIKGNRNTAVRTEPGLVKLDPQTAQNVPSAFGDFNRVLTTLPGVVSNNELSSNYSVRGGNYDENLVYVNNILVYRPFLIRAGQQEGLSFINPDMVADVAFSSGGWQAKYGDKLSSVLNVQYKRPNQTKGSLQASLLGGAASLGGKYKNLSYIAGVRHKSAQYLLNTLETNGEYLPRFTDVQSYFTLDLDKDPDRGKSELGILLAYANNRYLVRPQSQQTDFGTLQQAFRFSVGYAGQEVLTYQTFQIGTKLDQHFGQRWRTQWMASWITTREREYYDQLAAYRLCDVNTNDGSDDCETTLGLGANYDYARNKLAANIFSLENRTAFAWNAYNTLEFGVGYNQEDINDRIDEYSFTDSADYVTINGTIDNELNLDSHRLTAFVQNTTEPNSAHTLNYGVRLNYWNVNQQWLVSPRVQYAYQPEGRRDLVFRLGAGLYQQPPFYRELRNRQGVLNRNVRAQSALHFIAGVDHRLKLFGRDFTLLSEIYYKYLYNVNPYDIDNVRIRYFAENSATAYATGIDFRINGEFIPGAESWFSIGLLRTREDIAEDGVGYVRRPSDQLINLGIFFQDHLPNDPTVRVYLSFLYGSGLPFGPPGRPDFRNALNGSDYRRIDIGFSKQIALMQQKKRSFFRSLWLGVEVLNTLGTDNVISYSWIEALNRQQYAVPNRLSARFINVQVILR